MALITAEFLFRRYNNKTTSAFRLRISSLSQDGADVHVVPQGRVLRWEAGQQEQQSAMEQSILWVLEGQNCSCQALEEPLAGSYITLGDMHNERLVLRTLVKWSRDEKELKKFITSAC